VGKCAKHLIYTTLSYLARFRHTMEDMMWENALRAFSHIISSMVRAPQA
jgi:hypothetical protein